MSETMGAVIIVILLLHIAALVLAFCWHAERMMREEAQRAQLRRSTAAAMRYDRHMERLRRAGMHAQYRREKRA